MSRGVYLCIHLSLLQRVCLIEHSAGSNAKFGELTKKGLLL